MKFQFLSICHGSRGKQSSPIRCSVILCALGLALTGLNECAAQDKQINVEPTLTVAPTPNTLSTANFGGTVDKLQPQIVLEKPTTGTEDNQQVKLCMVKVTNIDALPDSLFTPAPYLKPLAENTVASRSWVYVLDQDGNPLSTFATIVDKSALNKLWFAVQKDVPAPKKIYVDIWDRQNDRHYRSKTVDVP